MGIDDESFAQRDRTERRPDQPGGERRGSQLGRGAHRRGTLRYGAPADGIAPVEKSLALTKLNPVAKWEQQVRKVQGNITAAITYFLVDDKVIDGGTQTLDATNTLFVVPPPQAAVAPKRSLVPSGDWSDVAEVVVSLKYDAGAGRSYDKELSSPRTR